MNCPFCGKEMQHGVMSGYGTDGFTWNLGVKGANGYERIFAVGEITAADRTSSALIIEADYCNECRKMIFDTDVKG